MVRLQGYTLERLKKNSGEELQVVTTSSAVILSAFGQEGNIFSMCCNTGDFLKVTITAIPLLVYFTDCSTFRNAAYDVTLAERRVGACRSGKKENSLRKKALAPCLPNNEGKTQNI